MRVYAAALLGTAALPICVSSSFGLTETVVDVSTGVRTNVGVHCRGLIDCPVKVRSTTDEEDKMPRDLASFVSGEQRNMLRPDIVLEKVMGTLHANRDVYRLASDAFDHLKQIDSHVMPQIVEEVIAWYNAAGFHLNDQEESTLLNMVLGYARNSVDGEKHLVQTILNQKKRQPQTMYHPVGPDLEAKQGHAFADQTRSVKSEPMHTRHESLDSLLVAFGGAAELAPILSIAKKSRVVGHRAEELQRVMLNSWLGYGDPVDVFNWLKLSELRRITYEDLDTFAQYIDLYNVVYGKKEDMLSFLRRKFTDEVLAMMILRGTGTSKNIRGSHVWQRVGDGTSAVDFVSSILYMAVDVDSLLDPLLVATSGAARLAPILSAAKMDPVIGFRAEQLQNAMLKRWLDSGKPIDDVFNFLQLLDLGKRGITSENLDTFAQYIDLYNNKYGKKEDMLSFLRKTFTDKVFAMMILEGTGTSKNIRDGYVWRRMGDGKSAVDFVASILFFAIDLDSLLDPLLAAFGGAAKLMPVLLKTKMNPVTGFRARQLYIVMLKRWLHSGKSVGNVIGLLEMNNLKIDDISRAEDDILEQYGAGSDTLKEYIKLYHEKHGTDMDLASCVEAEKIEKALANERGKRKGETQKRKGVSQPATIRAVRQKRLG